jgi:hypothetical protein
MARVATKRKKRPGLARRMVQRTLRFGMLAPGARQL